MRRVWTSSRTGYKLSLSTWLNLTDSPGEQKERVPAHGANRDHWHPLQASVPALAALRPAPRCLLAPPDCTASCQHVHVVHV
jgi:hypothetical protein